MENYARIETGVVAEIIPPLDGTAIEERFSAEFVADLVACGVEVQEGWTYDGTTFALPIVEVSLEDRIAVVVNAISVKVAALMAIGYPAEADRHIALDGDTRADLGAMATTAALAISGVTVWPESYSKGWITIENIRIPLPTPQDGITLGAAVGDYYAQVRQHARDLKDAVMAAQDAVALDAIDIQAGWPEGVMA